MFLESGGLFSVVVVGKDKTNQKQKKKTSIVPNWYIFFKMFLKNSMKVILLKSGYLKKEEIIKCRQHDLWFAKGFFIVSQIKRTPSHNLQTKFLLNHNCGESFNTILLCRQHSCLGGKMFSMVFLFSYNVTNFWITNLPFKGIGIQKFCFGQYFVFKYIVWEYWLVTLTLSLAYSGNV